MSDLTYGEKAVGIDFNPNKDLRIDAIKGDFATIINMMDALRTKTENPEVRRMCSIAITEAQTAQMWAVKAFTWKY